MRTAAAIMRTMRATLREIFDESAYARFLRRHGYPRCGRSYQEFLRERYGSRPRPRCC